MNATCMKILSDMPMTEHHRQQIRRCRTELVKSMIPEEVIGELQSKGVLTERNVQKITRAEGMDAQNEALLDILQRKPDSAFEHMCTALGETGQRHVASLLRKRK